jgi:hypothetical protein
MGEGFYKFLSFVKIYIIEQLVRVGPPAWELCGGLVTHHSKKPVCYKMLHRDTRGWRRLHNELRNLYTTPNVISVMKSRRMRCVGCVAYVGRRDVHTEF